MARWVKWTTIAILLGLIWAAASQTPGLAQQKPSPSPPVSVLPPPVGKPSSAPAAAPLAPPPGPTDLVPPNANRPGSVLPSPEVSPYPYPANERSALDPKTLLQQRAAQESAARMRRLTALKWFGYCNSRPVAGVDCIHSDYSPSWTANNPHYPFRWVGAGPTWVGWLPAIPSAR
ncbi:MAG: hypothetical protein NZ602_09875 [Thermoguttaceae bacterium]|nr:hypothetical protein [Thermoguttaceae bacterium]MDW8037042.1 hypothetical protein [Thermoguttaceae bacterium]